MSPWTPQPHSADGGEQRLLGVGNDGREIFAYASRLPEGLFCAVVKDVRGNREPRHDFRSMDEAKAWVDRRAHQLGWL